MDEERQARLAAILDRSAELTARTEELLASPRPESQEEWRVPKREPKPEEKQHPTESQAARMFQEQLVQLQFAIEGLRESHERLKQSIETDFVDMIGAEAGLLEQRLRKEIEILRNEVTQLRAARNTPHKASIRSRAPFKMDDDEHAVRNYLA